MQDLVKRLTRIAMEKSGGNKREAVYYLQKKATFYARKADRYYGTPYHERWRRVYRAYSSAEFQLGYWLSLDEEQEALVCDPWDYDCLGAKFE